MTWIGRMLALAATAATGVLLHTASTRQHVTALVADHHAALLHLLATTLSTGLQLWTTFGSGIIAFKTLPRHTFGHLQSKLFPVYFSIVCVTTALQLLTLFVMTSQLATPASQFQFKALLVALGGAVLNIAVFGMHLHCCTSYRAPHPTEPATTSVMRQRHVFEKQHSSTQGGPSSADIAKLKAAFPQYKALCSRFGAYHGLSSLANLVTLAACLTHVWYLSTRLTF